MRKITGRLPKANAAHSDKLGSELAPHILANGRFAPILLKKSFGGGERNFLEPLMRFVRSYLGDHVASQKNDQKPLHRCYSAS